MCLIIFIITTLFPDPLLPSHLSPLLKSFKISFDCPNILGCVLPLESSCLTSGYSLKENSLSQQLAFSNNFMIRGESLCPVHLSMLEFGLAWACPGFVDAVSSYVTGLLGPGNVFL